MVQHNIILFNIQQIKLKTRKLPGSLTMVLKVRLYIGKSLLNALNNMQILNFKKLISFRCYTRMKLMCELWNGH